MVGDTCRYVNTLGLESMRESARAATRIINIFTSTAQILLLVCTMHVTRSTEYADDLLPPLHQTGGIETLVELSSLKLGISSMKRRVLRVHMRCTCEAERSQSGRKERKTKSLMPPTSGENIGREST